MAKLQKELSGEDMMTEPNQATIDRMQEVMAEKAAELFRMCDKEEKGFITKRDMQRLRSELPVSQDQLEVVFDSLDGDGNGYLSLEEFTDGFGSFLGLRSPVQTVNTGEEVVGDDDLDLYEEDSNENELQERQFSEMIRQIGASHLFDDEDIIKAMWKKLQREEPDMVSTFEDFLYRLSKDMRKTTVDFQSLETALASKSLEHEEEVKKLYEEMELQIKQEREKILSEEKAKERQLKSDLEQQLEDKERQLQEILTRHQEMEDKLSRLNQVETVTKLENERLQKEKDQLEEQLGQSQDDLEESRSYIMQMQMQAKDEKRERARQALMMTEGIAIERESLVKQLDILKDVNKRLRDDRDEAEATDARRDGTTPSLDEELKAGESEREPHQPATSEQTNTAPTRKTLCKQGSVLSNYFPGGKPPRKRTSSAFGSADLEGMFHMENMAADEDDIEVDDDLDEEMLQGANVFYGGSEVTEVKGQFLHHRHDRRVSSQDGGGAEELGQLEEEEEDDDRDDREEEEDGEERDEEEGEEREEEEEDEEGARVGKGERSGKEIGKAKGNKKKTIGTKKKRRKFLAHGKRSQPVGADSENTSPEEDLTPKPQRIFKVVFVGDSGVGKSCFIHRFCHNEFKGNFAATIGVDFQIKAVESNNTTSILQVWDTAGQERFRSMTKMYFRKADGVIIMYDVTSEQSFVNVRNWLSSVHEQVESDTVLALLGNKMDLVEDEKYAPVKEKDGMLIALENEAIFYETSAQSGLNVQEAMEAIASLLQEKEDKRMEEGLKLVEEVKKKGCCGR